MRYAYQFSNALKGISITGEAGDKNGFQAVLQIQEQV